MTTAALLLAAGQSRRFGPRDKLLAPLDGRTVIEGAMAPLLGAQVQHRLAVVSSEAVAVIASTAGFEVVMVPTDMPQSHSLFAGIEHLAKADAARALIALGDMPFLQATDIDALLGLAGDDTACTERDGTPLPPAVFPRRIWPALTALSGDRGAGSLLPNIPAQRRLALPAARLRDVDLPADLALPR
ncbi:nucleotidyltransferase family protein [Paracoccus suum]|uniref:Nucleotidyltransferase family protein n=1 Tax=Paracoccus suum TaxID=2259340 RepID=A0A344PMT5_9RHOB|nr:nucleotidyltransferase family protein [Paracoccus suum]AXC50690.1 nucleotidyltransferase family protein [Paracoccus suum]